MELAPCPFCGGAGLLSDPEYGFDKGRYFVVCSFIDGCGAQGPRGHSSEEAKANWNRRPADALGGVHRTLAPPSSAAWDGTPAVTRAELIALVEQGAADARGIDDLAAAREKRELEGLPTITTTADQGGVGMDFNMFGAPPPKPRKR